MGVVNTMLASNLGPQAISAIGMVDSVSFIAISIFSSLAVGGTVVVAQYTGRGDRDNANRAAAQALTSTIAIVITLTLILFITQKPLLNTLYAEAEADVMQNALSYMRIVIWSFLPLAVLSVAFGILRGAGDTKTPMQVSITMNLLNLVLSYILI
jgi:Na+-driven multidrug efflux pump